MCFPHAGGSAGLFHSWTTWLAPDIELVAVQYPGRQERIEDPFPDSIESLADQITEQLAPFLDLPLSLFGHSMGSALVYEVAGRLEGRCDLTTLFVSGSPAPHDGPPGTLHLTGDDELVAWALELGSAASQAYTVPELRALLMPSLRADRRLVDVYRPARVTPLRTRMIAFGGDADPGCSPGELASWQKATTEELEVRVFPGDHFYLQSRTAELVLEINEFVRR
ncbi:alpha/beta fold hydrolase [Streptosporangium sp. NPDC048865]|uniref:thioesterase II family protein n=1 Tax=Streptosporangium sp. NPDC048865 TaxID=3155766 RepID=UPI0034449E95